MVVLEKILMPQSPRVLGLQAPSLAPEPSLFTNMHQAVIHTVHCWHPLVSDTNTDFEESSAVAMPSLLPYRAPAVMGDIDVEKVSNYVLCIHRKITVQQVRG